MNETLIAKLLQLPDHVRRGDFVLKLSEGVERADETLKTYVVTPQLVDCFDQALSLIQSGLSGQTSKACYLHGSFGSGKSHFMAVLDLILQGNTTARAIPELAGVIAKHNDWADGKSFMQVPIHMIGGESMEQKILGGYVEHVRSVHPDAPTPPVFRSDQILADARGLRESMGDEAFFAKLSGSMETVDDGWGELDTGWDAGRFDAACDAPPGGDDRRELVSGLIDVFFSAIRSSGDYIDMDHGMSVISQHAAKLGYDGIILFLDELILWLASHSADMSFVSQEGQKLAKLVEAQAAHRPVPIISFVARQRDLKDLVGDNVTGAAYTSFSDVLGWWEARFATIKLEDRNLPAIAEKRVLLPVSPEAKTAIDEAFQQTASARREVLDVLLTSQHTQESFRRIYPFSLAFMDMLVEMSFLLQRDRTALKVMLQLLIDQKETLALGDVVPVGDLFDYIAEGDEAVSNDVRHNFDSAKRLYEGKFRPLLEREHGVSVDDLPRLLAGEQDEKLERLQNDDRLVKTLLLAALAPNVESFRNLTAKRLASLNHGTIRSPIRGQEGRVVLQKCKAWAAEIGQIKISDDPVNPRIAVQLTGVDTESIISAAQTFDNMGNRVRMVRHLLFRELGITDADDTIILHPFRWRGTKRECQIILGNVRDLPEESLVSRSERWQVVIDLPFDEPGHGPSDDKARVSEIIQSHPEGTRTIVLLPSFLGKQAQNELKTLVILDNLLRGTNLNSYANHLTEAERQDARSILQNQRSQLEHHLVGVLESAYGISSEYEDAIDESHSLEPTEHFQALDTGFPLKPPASADFRQALQSLLDQALGYQFPAHPRFEGDAKLSSTILKRTYADIERAAQTEDRRALIEKSQRRDFQAVVEPLHLGQMGETHFVLGHEWQQKFLRKQQETEQSLTVARLRRWIDEPEAMGLPPELQDLVIMTFAVQTNHTFFQHGASFDPEIGSLPDEAELRTIDLPEEQEWRVAVKRGGEIFGVAVSALRNAANVAKFTEGVTQVAAEHQDACFTLQKELKSFAEKLGLSTNNDRCHAADGAVEVIQNVMQNSDGGVIRALSSLKEDIPFAAIGASMRKASDVCRALDRFDWSLIDTLHSLPAQFEETVKTIKKELEEGTSVYEHVTALAPVLAQTQKRIVSLANEALRESHKEAGEHEKEGASAGAGDRETAVGAEGSSTAPPPPTMVSLRGCFGSDYDDAVRFYATDREAINRNRRLVSELKQLYNESQVKGDKLPKGLPQESLLEVLEVHHIVPLSAGGEDSWANMVVVSPTLHALLHTDPKSTIELEKGQIVLCGTMIDLDVEDDHLGASHPKEGE